jgi:hypothetical protein
MVLAVEHAQLSGRKINRPFHLFHPAELIEYYFKTKSSDAYPYLCIRVDWIISNGVTEELKVHTDLMRYTSIVSRHAFFVYFSHLHLPVRGWPERGQNRGRPCTTVTHSGGHSYRTLGRRTSD